MHPALKIAVREALERSEAVPLPSITEAARLCVRAQLDAEAPDQYVVHRCLRTLYQQMRRTAHGGNETNVALDETLAIVKSCMNATAPKADHLYSWIAPKARLLKAAVQMLIGTFAVFLLGAKMWHGRSGWIPHFPGIDDGLELIGEALAAATVVELAYTLFTDGPDEVLDPLMLGITAFLIIELGKSYTRITWTTGIGLLLSAISLGLLFVIRQRFIEETGKPSS